MRFFSVIKRLINLLSDVAREIADSAAARKQAEGAQRHLESLTSNDPSVRFYFSIDKNFEHVFRYLENRS
jgi:hypothetical protein